MMRLLILALVLPCGTACSTLWPFGHRDGSAGEIHAPALLDSLPPVDALHDPALLPYRHWKAQQRATPGSDTLDLSRKYYRALHAQARQRVEARAQQVRELKQLAKALARQERALARIQAKANRPGFWESLFNSPWPWVVLVVIVGGLIAARRLRIL